MDYGLSLSNNPKYQNAGPYFRAFQSHPPIYPSGPEMKDNVSGESFLRWLLAVSSIPPYIVVERFGEDLHVSAISLPFLGHKNCFRYSKHICNRDT